MLRCQPKYRIQITVSIVEREAKDHVWGLNVAQSPIWRYSEFCEILSGFTISFVPTYLNYFRSLQVFQHKSVSIPGKENRVWENDLLPFHTTCCKSKGIGINDQERKWRRSKYKMKTWSIPLRWDVSEVYSKICSLWFTELWSFFLKD